MSLPPPFSNFRPLKLGDKLSDKLRDWKLRDWKLYWSAALRESIQNPRRLGSWLEEHNPWLSRQVLSAASNLADPYIAGMGLQIERLDEDGIEVHMPHRWRNRGEGGVVHVGALATLAEFVSRVYWERNLNLGRHEMRVGQLAAKFLAETEDDTRAVMSFSESERESTLFRLRSEGEVTVSCAVKIYETSGRLIADATVEWTLTRPRALGTSPDGRQNSRPNSQQSG